MLLRLLGAEADSSADEIRMRRLQRDAVMANTLMECEAWPWLRDDLVRRAEALEAAILDESSALEGSALASARATAKTYRSVLRLVEGRPAAFQGALEQLREQVELNG